MAKSGSSSFGFNMGARIKTNSADIPETPSVATELEPETAAAPAAVQPIIKTPSKYDEPLPDEAVHKENRTKRLNLIVEPTNYKKLKKYLDKRGLSVNGFVCDCIDQFVKEHNL